MIKQEKNEPSLVQTETAEDPSGPRHLTESQASALNELSALCRLAGHSEAYGGFKPRAKPLLIGPSGSGKSALVTRLCDTEKLPLLIINSGSWIVFGARSEPHTLAVIRSFIRKYERGCIFLDEIDKCVPAGSSTWKHSWDLSILTEMLALLDNQRLSTSDWTKADMNRLARNFVIIGAGAWQLKSKKAGSKPADYAKAVIADFGIPEEIAFRFNSRLIVINHPSRKDLANAIRRVHADFGLKAVPESDLERIVDAAVESRCGMRWVEQMVSDILASRPQLLRPSAPSEAEVKSEKTKISCAAFTIEKDNLYRLLEAAEPAIAQLRVHVSLMAHRLTIAPKKTDCLLDILENDQVMTSEKWDQCFQDLQFGLHLRYAISDLDRENREKKLWYAGQKVLEMCQSMTKDKVALLASEQALANFLNASVRLSRILDAFQYIGTLELPKDE